jgi:hypothetical protein
MGILGAHSVREVLLDLVLQVNPRVWVKVGGNLTSVPMIGAPAGPAGDGGNKRKESAQLVRIPNVALLKQASCFANQAAPVAT